MSKKILFFLFLICFSFQTAVAGDSSLFVQRMVPEGKGIRQADKIVFEFNRPVVALGEMERDADQVPIEIKPRLNCRWRWLNQTSLACILGEKDRLAAAELYKVRVKPEFRALSGEEMEKGQSFVLETVRPEINVSRTRFMDFITPERPRWRVVFDTDTQMKSVRSNMFFKVGSKKIKADVASVECQDWETDCQAKYLVFPVKDLGVGQPYELVYESGFKALNGGDLKSEKEGIAGKGKTLPVFQAESLQCYDKNFSMKSYGAEETRLNIPECQFDFPVNIVLSDKTVLENVSDFVKGQPAVSVNERAAVSNVISVSAPKAGETYTLNISDSLTDVWGAKIEKPETFFFKTGDRRAELKLPYSSVVLESGEETHAVGYATNLNKAEVDFSGFTAREEISGVHNIAEVLPSIRNVSYPFDYGVRAMLDGRSGFVAGHFKTVPALEGRYFFTASVSPWQVVAKIGWDSSLVWVVDFKTGKPVSGAEVELYAGPLAVPRKKNVLADEETDKTGRADLPGYQKLDPKAAYLNQWDVNKDSLFVQVSKGKETAVLPLNGSFSLSAGALSDWDISSVYFPAPYLYLRAFGFTPQGIYRPGDTVDFKIYVRKSGDKMLEKAPKKGYELIIADSMGQTVFEQKGLSLSPFGALNGSFTLPPQAVSGWYDVTLKHKDASLYPMRFLVSDFSASAFKSSTEVNGGVFKAGGKVQMNSRASLFSGGAYAGAKMRQSAVLSFAPFTLKTDGDAFGFSADLTDKDYAPETLFDQDGLADEKGILQKTFVLPKSAKPYGKIRFETKVFDDSGRTVSSFASADYFSTDRLVGLRRGAEAAVAGKPAGIEYVVADTKQNLVAGVPVRITFFRTANKLVREKSAGNAYLMKYVSQEEKAGECMGMSATKPQKCTFTPAQSGMYKAVASINGHTSRLSFYVDGSDYVPWASAENRLKIVPDKKNYKIGDKIVLTVENPVPGALALVTVERYGVLDSFVQPFDQSVEKIEIPVGDDFFPGIYVSVAAFSPRVDKPVDGEVDLGKPAQWTGYVKIPVLDESRQIEVKVTPQKQDYRPGQTMTAQISAALPGKEKQPVEAAVIVVDEAVLSLLPKGAESFDPYLGLNRLGDLDVRTYSLVEQLIGRQKIEKKGANQGGDGGSDFAMRDVFKFVAYFNPSLLLDKNGRATFDMKLPDNLTGWRIIVLAVTPEEFAGMGQARVNVTQPLEIRALLPNQLRTGDTFSPGASVLNRTARQAAVSVSLKASGALDKAVSAKKQIVLKPFERQSVFFDDVKARLNPSDPAGEIVLTFTADDGTNRDGLKQTLSVLNLTTFETAALYGSAAGTNVSLPLDIPAGVKAYGGSLSVSAAPGFLTGLKPAVEAMRDYPHPCWEQKISRAVAAAVYAAEKKAVWPDDLWPDAADFVRLTLKQAPSYQAQNGGMAYFVAENRFVSPYLSAYTAYVFDYLERAGYEIPRQTQEKLADYLLGLFKRTDQETEPAALLTTRLLSAAFLKQKGLISDADIAVFDRFVPLMSAFDKALYLRLVPDHQVVFNDLMNDSYQTSGSLIFKDTGNENYDLLSSPAKTTCMALAAVSETDPDKAEALMRGAYTLRRGDGTWVNTQANAFCMMGLQTYAGMQSDPVDLNIRAMFEQKEILSASFTEKSDPAAAAAVRLGEDQAGRKTAVDFKASGQGRYYYSAALSYPSDVAQSVNAGLAVERRFFVRRGDAFVPVDASVVLKRGELVKVELTVINPVAQYFVALRDPVAGAFEPVNSLLATASAADLGEVSSDGAFGFKDTGHAFVGFYAEYLPAGTHRVSYAAQVVADGVFAAFPAKAEAMYTPDVFGLTAANVVKVAP